MKAKLTIKLGDKDLTLEGEGKESDIIKSLSFWCSLPNACGKCGETSISILHKSPKENDYYGLVCLSCRAELTFHQKKTGGFYLTKEDSWEVWNGKSHGGGKTSESSSEEPPLPSDEDCPF